MLSALFLVVWHSFNAVFTFPWLPSVVGCDGFLPKKAGVRGVSCLQFWEYGVIVCPVAGFSIHNKHRRFYNEGVCPQDCQ